MLAQGKSDGLITRKSLDQNEDMYFFFVTYYCIVLWKNKILLGSTVYQESMLAQWESDGLITRKSLDRNEDMYFFCHIQ